MPADGDGSRTDGRPGSDRVSPFWLTEPRRRLLLQAIVLLALAVRIAYVYRVNRLAPNGASRLGGDEPEYDSFARSLLAGHWSSYPGRGPGYPALLAVLPRRLGGQL